MREKEIDIEVDKCCYQCDNYDRVHGACVTSGTEIAEYNCCRKFKQRGKR